jgi:hypothetical protein
VAAWRRVHSRNVYSRVSLETIAARLIGRGGGSREVLGGGLVPGPAPAGPLGRVNEGVSWSKIMMATRRLTGSVELIIGRS